jgi:hypothetical protein
MSNETTRIVGMNARQHVAPIGNRLYRRLPTCGTADYQSALHQISGSWRVKTKNKLVKPTIQLSAITVPAALALMGCNQNSPSNSTETPSSDSSLSHDNGMMHGSTNMVTTNNMPQMNTNMPANNHP